MVPVEANSHVGGRGWGSNGTRPEKSKFYT